MFCKINTAQMCVCIYIYIHTYKHIMLVADVKKVALHWCNEFYFVLQNIKISNESQVGTKLVMSKC